VAYTMEFKIEYHNKDPVETTSEYLLSNAPGE
jgi:hypothetical protein